MKGIMIILLLILISACSSASLCEPQQSFINWCTNQKKSTFCTWELGFLKKYTCKCRCR